MATKKLTLEDFIAPALSDEPTKLFIHLDGKETKEYLNVICSSHGALKRPLMKYGIEANKLKTKCESIKDDIDKAIAFSEGEEPINKELASKMVVGWSLGVFNSDLLDKLLTGNEKLVQGIQVQSFTVEAYIKKK